MLRVQISSTNEPPDISKGIVFEHNILYCPLTTRFYLLKHLNKGEKIVLKRISSIVIIL
jgi:hypothetical protein